MASNPAGEMPFLDHLEELRWRIIWSLVAIIVGLVIGFYLVTKFDVLLFLQQPITPYLQGQGDKLRYTHPADTFSITLSMALAVGALVASPVILYQVWAFLSPALHKHERRVVIPVIVFAFVLFLAGVALAWFFVIPLCLKFLMNFQSASLEPMIMVKDYFSMVTILTLAFGASFELPVLVLALAAMGLVTPAMLGKARVYALITTFLLSALITPGDMVVAALALTAPLYLLYELSIVLTSVIYRRKRKAAEADQAAADAAPAPRGLM